MILNCQALTATEINTDIAIIGGGASGLALASRLNRDTVVIEGGTFETNPERDKKFVFETTGLSMNTQSLRRQLVGGAGATWSGRCTELEPEDFESRPWMNSLGWPISAETLSPYFKAAWRMLGLKTAQEIYNDEHSERSQALDASNGLELQMWQYAFERAETPIDLGMHFANTFKGSHRTLLMGAQATTLTTEDAKITGLEIVDHNGQKINIRAQQYVLACGCVEVSRFLLDNLENCRALIGPIIKWLGHGFHQHLLVDGGGIEASNENTLKLQKSFNRFRRKPAHSVEWGLRLNGAIARKELLTNASATFRYFRNKKKSLSDSANLVLCKLRGTEPIFSDPEVRVELSIEQEIDRSNKISLSPTLDQWGRRTPTVNWKINALELRTASAMNNRLNCWLKHNNIGRMDSLLAPQAFLEQPKRESLHHMGGTQMSDNAANGVVDPNLKLHGSENLYVVGGAVFPSGGHANPTLTMMALSLRLAEHLNRGP